MCVTALLFWLEARRTPIRQAFCGGSLPWCGEEESAEISTDRPVVTNWTGCVAQPLLFLEHDQIHCRYTLAVINFGGRNKTSVLGTRAVQSFFLKAPTFLQQTKEPTFSQQTKAPTFLPQEKAPTFFNRLRHQPFYNWLKHQPFHNRLRHQPFHNWLRHQPFYYRLRHQPFYNRLRHQPFYNRLRHQPRQRHQPFYNRLGQQPIYNRLAPVPIREWRLLGLDVKKEKKKERKNRRSVSRLVWGRGLFGLRHETILRASFSGTFRQTPPELIAPLKGHSLSPRTCPPTRSAPSERLRY